MASINWNESAPAGADSAGLGAGEFRSLKTAIRTGLDAEHNWPSAGGDAGVHRLGSGRPFVGLQSAVSSSGTDGRMMWTSDTSQLFHVGSGGTAFVGGARGISAGSYPVSVPQRHQWIMEWGEGKTASGQTIITIPNSGFSSRPYVVLTAYDDSTRIQTVYLTSISATQFTVKSSATNDLANSSTSFEWLAAGPRVL